MTSISPVSFQAPQPGPSNLRNTPQKPRVAGLPTQFLIARVNQPVSTLALALVSVRAGKEMLETK
jgi:hypothetical protein